MPELQLLDKNQSIVDLKTGVPSQYFIRFMQIRGTNDPNATTITGGGGLTGGGAISSGAITISLSPTAVTPGSYTFANFTVDSYGRLTAASNGTVFNNTTAGLVPASGGGTTNFLRADGTWAAAGAGSVTSITAGTGLTGGTITSTGTIALATSGVTAGSYTSANVTVDAYGRVTSATSNPVTVFYRPLVTGSGPPVFIYEPNGSLIMEAFTPGT